MTESLPVEVRNEKYVLVTGCSTGIGRASALQLAAQGWHVFAGVRREQDGLSLVAEQRSTSHPQVGDTASPSSASSESQPFVVNSDRLIPVLLDVTREESVCTAIEWIEHHMPLGSLHGLVNNAGVLIPGPLELLTSGQLKEQFEVNVFGTHRITQAALPLLRRSSTPDNSARLVMVGSISGRVTPPYYGGYAASKHALEAMTDAWRMELKPWKIGVSIIQPDSVSTPIWDKASSGIHRLTEAPGLSAEELYAAPLRATRRSGLAYKKSGLPPAAVVRAISHALNSRTPKTHYCVGWRTRAAFVAQSVLPVSWMDFILRKSLGL
jgi:NAD(P)-dependent dehydrogenase (short-subunit alcohol dehydrogenase family)